MSDKTMAKRDRIIEFIRVGLSDTEIAGIVKISASSGYIRRVRRSLSDNAGQSSPGQSTPKLTSERYYNAMKQNNGTKEELAAKLGVSRMTLHNFEKATGLNKKLAEYLYLRGMSISQIARTLGTKESTLKKMGLEELPTLDGIKEQMERALQILGNVSDLDEEIAIKCYSLNKIFDKLK